MSPWLEAQRRHVVGESIDEDEARLSLRDGMPVSPAAEMPRSIATIGLAHHASDDG